MAPSTPLKVMLPQTRIAKKKRGTVENSGGIAVGVVRGGRGFAMPDGGCGRAGEVPRAE